MKTNVQLQIPKPCNQDWNQMKPNAEGRHCASCNNVVVDFTNWRDDEVLQYFSTLKTSVCGRLRDDQMHKPPLKPLNRKLKRFLVALVFAFVLTSADDLAAQASDSLKTPSLHQIDSTRNKVSGEVYGKVTNEKGERLDFASVVVMQGGIVKAGAKTNLNGYYKIRQIEPGNYIIKVTYPGYTPLQIPIEVKVLTKKEANLILVKDNQIEFLGKIGFICTPSLINRQSPGTQKLNSEQIQHMSR